MPQIQQYDTLTNVKKHLEKGRLLSKGADLTISGGTISVTDSFHLVATEGGASSDDLTTINAAAAAQPGQLLVLMAADDAKTVVMKHNAGSGVKTLIGSDFNLDSKDDTITLMWTGAKWVRVGSSAGNS